MVRVATDEIVYVRADGNYSDLVLANGKSRRMTFQLNYFEKAFHKLQNNLFVRVGRSLIVNKRYIYVINLTEQQLILSGGKLKEQVIFDGQDRFNKSKDICISRDALKQLKELLDNDKEVDNE